MHCFEGVPLHTPNTPSKLHIPTKKKKKHQFLWLRQRRCALSKHTHKIPTLGLSSSTIYWAITNK